jgi:hypothetical protein
LVIIFNGRQDRSVERALTGEERSGEDERAPPGEELSEEGATGERSRIGYHRQKRSRTGYRRRKRSWT